jgi:hypothetical protein
MEFDPSLQTFFPDDFDREHLGIVQQVSVYDVYQMGRLVAKNLAAVDADGFDPPRRPRGQRADQNLGLLCLHTDSDFLLRRVRESGAFRL